MNGLILGVDLCDSYSQISCYSPGASEPEPILMGEAESTCLIPTVLCKQRGQDQWYIGSEGYRRALLGEGTMVDKLVKLLKKGGGATIEGIYYDASDLLMVFIRELLELARNKYGERNILSVAICLQQLDAELLDRLMLICDRLELPRRCVKFLSHTECFSYYVVSRPKDLWQNQVVAFDLTDKGLDFFEFRAVRGRKPAVLEARREHLEEGFDLDLLETPLGERMGDKILSACAERMLQKKVVSTVFLTGEGFTSVGWAPELLKRLCNKRKVFQGQHLFADGAALLAYDGLLPESQFPYLCICEGRLSSTISVAALHEGRLQEIVFANAGSNWYEARSSADFILDDVQELALQVTPFASGRTELIRISLAELPARPNKTTRIQVIVAFTSENHATVRIVDKGFGELFPSGGLVIRKDFLIS